MNAPRPEEGNASTAASQQSDQDRVADDRDRIADDRDRASEADDRVAQSRDDHATERDARSDARERRDGRIDLEAASDRSGAKRDRQAAAGGRRQAGADREASATDRSLAADERADQVRDELTGCYRRQAGFLELEREIVKAERTKTSFVLAFLDVDGLKATNDVHGHDAGDELLRQVVKSVRHVVREYDVLVRYGGDEFLCGLLDVSLSDVAERFTLANAELRGAHEASISVGLAEREPGETLGALIARADAAMYAARDGRPTEGRA